MNKEKLGVYVASYNNPVHLRQCLLQILLQQRKPEVLAIHENVHPRSYLWAVDDVLQGLRENGVEVRHRHSAEKFTMPLFFCWPLAALLDAGCTLFNKLDVDDMVYSDHLKTQESLIEDFDFAMNTHAQLTVLANGGGYRSAPDVDFGKWNPTGAHPNCIIYRRDVADSFLRELYRHPGQPDDVIFKEHVMPHYRGRAVALPPTMSYVAHGGTWSTAHWAQNPPPEVS